MLFNVFCIFFDTFLILLSATKACDGFNYMGVSAHWKKYCWNWIKPIVGNAEELSGAITGVFLLIIWYIITFRILIVFWVNWQNSEFCNQFFRTYFLTIEQEIFAVLTDTFHKPGFKLHVLVLQHLFCLVCICYFLFIPWAGEHIT